MARLARAKRVRIETCIRVLQAMAVQNVDGETSPDVVVARAEMIEEFRRMRAVLSSTEKEPAARSARGYDSENSIQDVERAAIEEGQRPGATRASVENVVWQRSVVGNHFPEKMKRGLVAGLAALEKSRNPLGVTAEWREVPIGGDPLETPQKEE